MALSTLTDTERHQRMQPVCAWCMELPRAPFELDNSPCDTLAVGPWQGGRRLQCSDRMCQASRTRVEACCARWGGV
jgi:hypothetical protein